MGFAYCSWLKIACSFILFYNYTLGGRNYILSAVFSIHALYYKYYMSEWKIQVAPQPESMSSCFHWPQGLRRLPCWLRKSKNSPVIQVTQGWSLGWEDSLEKEMATHSSTLAWRIPWTKGSGGVQSMGLQRIGHDWVTNTWIGFLFIVTLINLRYSYITFYLKVTTSIDGYAMLFFKNSSWKGVHHLAPHLTFS